MISLHKGDIIRLLDRGFDDPPGGTVISDTGQLVWFTTATGGCHVARRHSVRLIRRAVQQDQQDQHEETDQY